jgi:DNA polymerase elongation subunit (family B)
MSDIKFELTKIDPHNCSIDELKQEIKRLEDVKEEYNGKQHSIKIFINSVYGATASIYFTGYNVFVAEAITLQGQDLIFFANEILDDYFLNKWHTDTETHKALGVTNVKKVTTPRNTIVVYNDTDSTYMTFQPVLDSCDYEGDPKEFILKMKEIKLDKYFKEKFDEYGKKFNTKNIQNFELEKIAYNGLMMAKKKYILDTAWADPGIHFNKLEKLSFTGVEIVQSSTPKFVRKVLKELVNYLFENGKELDYADAVRKLKEYKAQFVMQEPDDIAKGVSIGDYEKYVLNDRKEIVLGDKCPINVRSASVYNHALFNSRWKNKYNLIKTGDKIKYYYAKSEFEVFGFPPGNYPYEFAPEIDYDRQFEKAIIEPFNRFIEVLGFNPIPGNLIYARSLF